MNPMFISLRHLAGGALAVTFAATALAQPTSITLTDGSVQVVLNNISGQRTGTTAGRGDFFISSSAVDHLSQYWFWYRSTGDSREYALSNLVSGGNVSNNHVRLVYSEPADDGAIAHALLIELEFTLTDLTPGSDMPDRARLVMAWKIKNRTDDDLNVQLYSYYDGNIAGTIGDDSAVLEGVDDHLQIITDGAKSPRTVSTFQASGTNLIRYQMSPFSQILSLLTDNAAQFLTNTGAPFGPGNYTGAFQWGTTLSPPNNPDTLNSLVGSVVIEIDTSVPGDINGDGALNFADINAFVELLGG